MSGTGCGKKEFLGWISASESTTMVRASLRQSDQKKLHTHTDRQAVERIHQTCSESKIANLLCGEELQ